MRLRRSSAPSSPGFLHASASARICRFSLAENRRRLAVATTSGSGARPAAGAAPSLALRAPCGAAPAAELICMSIKEEPIPLSVMSAPAGTLNGPRQVSQLRLARGGQIVLRRPLVRAPADGCRNPSRSPQQHDTHILWACPVRPLTGAGEGTGRCSGTLDGDTTEGAPQALGSRYGQYRHDLDRVARKDGEVGMLLEELGGGLVRLRLHEREGGQLVADVLDPPWTDFLGLSQRSSHPDDGGLMFLDPRLPCRHAFLLLRTALAFGKGVPRCASRTRLAAQEHGEKGT